MVRAKAHACQPERDSNSIGCVAGRVREHKPRGGQSAENELTTTAKSQPRRRRAANANAGAEANEIKSQRSSRARAERPRRGRRQRERLRQRQRERQRQNGATKKRNGGAAANGKHIFQPRRLFTTNFMAFGRKLLVSVERIAARENRTKIKQKKKQNRTGKAKQ